MARFRKRKFFRKPDSSTDITKNLEKEETRSEITEDGESFTSKKTKTVITEETNSRHNTSSLKSWTKSGTKYIYIIVAATLTSGIFTPLVYGGLDLEIVIVGTLGLFIGVTGGGLIFKGINRQNSSSVLILIGLGLIIVSLIVVFQVASIANKV